ncbi:MAG TPA: AraC family transcriptional regulator [Gemmatimonadaceae bacterium]|nr:AraC family transcriptional regulator [Gemmatimonadaceae bacterium]
MMRQLVEMNVADVAGLASRVDVRRDIPQIITTRAFDWPGLRLEAGTNNIASVDEVAGIHHYVSLNVDERPVTLELKGEHGFRRVVLRRGSAWVVPAGDVISLRVNSTFRYVRMSVDPIYFSRLAGDPDSKPIQLHRTYGVTKSQIGHILDALVAEADSGNPGGLAFVEALAVGLSRQIALHAGAPMRVERLRGGLSSAARRRTLEIMDAHYGANLTVDLLAHEVGLSPAHFARAFKETMGRAPHNYLLTLRLEKARRLLDDSEAGLSEVAQRTGFADQAHFTRLFKREFGVTPGALLKSRRI